MRMKRLYDWNPETNFLLPFLASADMLQTLIGAWRQADQVFASCKTVEMRRNVKIA